MSNYSTQALLLWSAFFLLGCTSLSDRSNGNVGIAKVVVHENGKVPFSRVGGHAIVVPVKINGSVDARFIFDTGIGIDLISQSICRKINCQTSGTYTGKRMSGQKLTIPLAQLDSLSFGSIKRAGTTVGVIDVSGFPEDFVGIDGFLSLKSFESAPITFDYKSGIVVVEDAASLKTRLQNGAIVPLDIERDALSIGIFLSMVVPKGRPARVEVDTGSDSFILNARFMTQLGISSTQSDVKITEGKDETGQIFIRYFARVAGKIHPAGALEFSQSNPKVMFQDIIYDGLIGDSFLRSFIVTYDLPNYRMIFARP